MSEAIKGKELTKKQAQARTAEHKAALADLKTGRVKLLRAVAKSIDLGVYKILGFSNQDDWLETIFEESVSHVRRLIHNVRALKGVPDSTVEQMPEGNAHELARLPEQARSKTLVAKATTQKPAEFKETLAKAKGIKTTEPPIAWGTYARRAPRAVIEKMYDAEEKMARVLELDIAEGSPKRATNLITIMEAFAELINGTPLEVLRAEVEGDEGNAGIAQSRLGVNTPAARGRHLP